ncbi:unnamed protein product [Leptidea sinapis]|uniref:Sm domain-containing protein n=1 Tax=Leptidea sinapis TaxID=189913 RepID=A0A5E4QQ04_9NEOP|nr:unnamed protein product [Leptidea sinapis]
MKLKSVKNDKELMIGTLQGFDDFVNMFLDDIEYDSTPEGRKNNKIGQMKISSMVTILLC